MLKPSVWCRARENLRRAVGLAKSRFQPAPFWPNAQVMTHPGLPLAIALIAAPFVAVLQSKAMTPLALIPMAITLGLGWRAGWRPGQPQGAVLLLGLLLAGWSTALLVFLVQRSMELRLQHHSKP